MTKQDKQSKYRLKNRLTSSKPIEEIKIPKECWASEYTEDEHIYAIEDLISTIRQEAVKDVFSYLQNHRYSSPEDGNVSWEELEKQYFSWNKQ